MAQRKNWSEEQIIGILKQVEAGRTVVEDAPLLRSAGIMAWAKALLPKGRPQVEYAQRAPDTAAWKSTKPVVSKRSPSSQNA